MPLNVMNWDMNGKILIWIYSGSTNTAYMYYLEESDYNTALEIYSEAGVSPWYRNDFYDQSNVTIGYEYILHKLNKMMKPGFSGRLWI